MIMSVRTAAGRWGLVMTKILSRTPLYTDTEEPTEKV